MTTVAEHSGAWAYAVAEHIQGDLVGGVTGVAGRPVHTVTAAGLTAAVSPVDLAEYGEQALRRNLEDLAWLEATAWVHHRVIDAIARAMPVVPIRLATVYRGDESVAAMLTQRRHALAAALARVQRRTEWGVKVYAVPGAQPAGPDTTARDVAAPGAAYLRRRKSQLSAGEQARRAAAASAEDVHSVLGGMAAADLVRPPQGPQLSGQAGQMIFNSSYLVDNASAENWSRAAEDVAARHPGVRVELTGPWPPYSFAEIDGRQPSQEEAR